MKLSFKVRCALLAGILATTGIATGQNGQSRRPQRTNLPDLTNNVNAMAFSPDSGLLAIARGIRDDNRVDLWDTGTGTLQRTIRGFDGPVWSVSFSPDGRTLLTGSSGVHQEKVSAKASARNGRGFAELKWWDVPTGEFKQRYELRDEDLISLAAVYSPDGKSLAAIEHRAQMMFSFEGQQTESIFPSPFRRTRPSIKYTSNIRLLDAQTGETTLKLKDGFSSNETPIFGGSMQADIASLMLTGGRRPAIFSPDGQFVAAWNASEVRLWSSTSGEEKLKLNKFEGRLKAVAFSPDGRLLATALTRPSRKHDQIELHSEIRVWEVGTGSPKQVIALRTQAVYSMTFALNGQQLLIGGLQNKEDHEYPSMELIDLQTGSVGSIISRDEGVISSINLAPDGEMMAFQTGASTVRLLDVEGWRVRYTFDVGNEPNSSGSASLRRYLVSVKSVPAVAFLPDGNTVAGEVESGGIKVWDARTGEVKKTVAQDADTGSIAEASGNGAVIAEINADETVRVWNVANGAQVEIKSGKSAVTAIGLSGNGKILAIAYPNEVDLLSVNDLKPQELIAPIPGKFTSLSLSSDGKLLAGVASDGELRVWRTEDGKLERHFAAGPGISTLGFAPNNQALAVGTKDGRMSLWDLQTSSLRFESKKHGAIVNAIAFSADGKLMATGSDDRTAIIWELTSGKPHRTLKGHDFTVTSLAFSPGNDLLAVGSGNASVVLWDVATGKLNRVMR